MKTISFKINDEEYNELKKVKQSPWCHFFLSSVSCPYCGNPFLFTTGKKLIYQQINHCICEDENIGKWPYLKKLDEDKYDIDIIAIKKEK